MDSRGGRFEAAAVEIFRPGGSAGFPGFFLERSLEGLVVPREVRGRWALLRLIPSSPPTRAPSTLRHPAAYERPPNTLSLSPSSSLPSLPPRNVIYLFTRFGLTRFFGPVPFASRGN